ncbi:hypothetical protein SAMN05216474_1163 [Lishizhenia tianjinensis]|uniref:Outer membrane protein beta-barrel domain-containing protein n=1 Tax=Lishizhenia tianjinensis TaxID=477690 RepID=A0A1I6YTL5_9FLAO|nr:hypothetical protein [Lishizhenia tianjinensis]SFT53767.1 hypothetical protein SAMN05216474_1163 [Lishizhenia tianjinensis]
MSLTDKDIDQLFRDAANSAPQVEFKEAYWDEMNAFLDQEEKGKRGIYSMLSVGILALIGIGSLLLIPNQNKYSDGTVAEQVDALIATPQNVVAMNAAQQNSTSAVKKNNAQTTSTLAITKTASSSNEETAVESSENVVLNTKSKKTSVFNTNALTDQMLASSAIAKENTTVVNVKDEKAVEETTQVVKNKELSTPTQNAQPILLKATLDPFANLSKKIDRLSVKEPGSLASSFGNSSASSLIDFKNIQRLKDRLYIELGAGISDNYNDAIAGRSFVYNGALNYEFRKNWFRVRTGVGVNITTQSNITYTTYAKIYDFGSRNSSNELVYKELYDLYLPIEIGASFNKVSFGVGFKYNFLNHSRAEFRTYQDGALEEEGVYYGLTEGLKQNTSSAYFFVERNLFNRVDLGIKMGTYLNSRAALTEQFDMVGQDINPKYGFVYLKYNFRK